MDNHFTALQNHYAEWLKTLGFSQSVVYNNPKMAHHFFTYLQDKGVHQISQLKSRHVSDYFSYLQNRSNMRIADKALSVSHLNKTFDAIDKFLEFLNAQACINAPTPTQYRIVQAKSDTEQKIKAFTKTEIQTFYKNTEKMFPHFTFKEAEPRKAVATLILDLCYGCGLRKSEAYKLLITDIDLDRKMLFVRQAKGYKDRYVPMSAAITERMKIFIYQYRKTFNLQHQRVFPFTLHTLPYYFKNLLRCSGLQYETGTGLHTLRHSIATHLLQNGMSIEQIARFLGHSTLESTQVYTHLIHEYEW